MDRNGFADHATGRLVPTIGGRKAFVANPLPPVLDVESFLPQLTRATQAVGELKGIGRSVANRCSSSARSSAAKPCRLPAWKGRIRYSPTCSCSKPVRRKTPGGDNREVLNYVRALEGAIDGLERDQNWIGGSGRIDTARFIPAPPADTPQVLDTLMAFVNREERPSPLIDAALAHYQFEAIHPFADGNGRVGRMLITLMLIDNGTLPQPLLYMSPYLERHKDRYIDLMYAVSRDGAWEAWIAFFLDAVAESAEETITVVERLQNLQQAYRARFQTARRAALMLRIIDLAFERPVRPIADFAEIMGVTYQGAANNINELIAHGVAEEVPDTYPKLIRFPGVLATLQVG